MKATREEQLSPQPTGKRFPVIELLLALAVVAGLAIFWRYWQEGAQPPAPSVDVPPTAAIAPEAPGERPPTPDIPRRDAPAPAAVAAGDAPTAPDPNIGQAPGRAPAPSEPAPLLSPQEGAELLRSELARVIAGPSIEKMTAGDRPLDTAAALIDGLGSGLILRKMVQVSPPAPGFKVARRGDLFYMDQANYGRYDTLAASVSGLDTVRLVDGFHTLRPLFEKTYETLGLDPADFDNAIVRALDLVLATPEISEPIAVKPKSVIYLYADPALESLPGVQKQLLRMGPDNIRLIKQQAKALRVLLLAP